MISKINYTGFSFVGRRPKNQDAILMEKIDKDTLLFAVADGMGGHNGGEIASKIALSTLLHSVKKKIKTQKDLKKVLKYSFKKSDEKIGLKAKENPELQGMGTTLVCLLIYKNKYVWANIGDSRIYILKDKILSQISDDHSYINEYENKNGKPVSVAFAAKYGHYLTKCLDGDESSADIFPPNNHCETLDENTCFMLCSDGLFSDRVNTNLQMFKNYITGEKRLEASAKNLIGQAFTHGSSDNISLILIDVGLKRDKLLKLKQFEYPPTERSKKNKKMSFISKFLKWKIKILKYVPFVGKK